jgi:hypothetical protein
VRTTQNLYARYRISPALPVRRESPRDPSANRVTAAIEALDGMGALVSTTCFTCPDTLTHEGITAYALALLRLRESAVEAELARLVDACDALAVTVSRLIEDRCCASRDKCDALTHFVVHAQAMIQMAVGRRHVYACTLPDVMEPTSRAKRSRMARASAV